MILPRDIPLPKRWPKMTVRQRADWLYGLGAHSIGTHNDWLDIAEVLMTGGSLEAYTNPDGTKYEM